MDGAIEVPRKPKSRGQRTKAAMTALHGEIEQLSSLTKTLLGHLETATRPGITDADRIRYRYMIQDIRQELKDEGPARGRR